MTTPTEESTAVTGSGRSFPRRLRQLLGEVAALVYLAVCAALLVWSYAVSVGDDSGGSMAGIIPLFAAAPASFVLLVLPDNVMAPVISVAFGALVNAVVIGWCARALRRGDSPDPVS
ncbi:SCO4225 family membrane protein [Streptomyces sp. NBC_00878]|uniref:SCO4225 family membrane protein n=1 Tax=Streptomyces sp. NBC_00878 TaxID=2975854 RepID=UPI00224E917F|nr:hypothetical protein [Streptomyces sp. NBC_00878]MCX4911629.1 hypothetical protein [Streptomyces sp. NBC_00878]